MLFDCDGLEQGRDASFGELVKGFRVQRGTFAEDLGILGSLRSSRVSNLSPTYGERNKP